jgi:hypothetical protein
MAALRPHCEQLVLFGVYPLTIINPPEENNNAADNQKDI